MDDNLTEEEVEQGSKAGEPDSRVSFWINEIAAARKREKEWRKEGQRILDIFDGSKSETTPFNILYSNTETLQPALYSATPRPVVDRRFKDNDPLGKAGAVAGKRVLEFLLDTNVEGYETFDQGVKAAVVDTLLPGRGFTTVKYDADLGEMEDGTEYKKSELVCLNTRSWNRVYHGFARKWSQVPWIAYEEYIDKEEAEERFGEQVASKLVFTETDEEYEEEEGKRRFEADDRSQRKTALIYQIWDKDGGRKVRYVAPQYKDDFLLVDEDPLKLTGFFNCPKPLAFIEKANDLAPVALYTLYENQAKELNLLTLRINRLVNAIKARGLYDGELGGELATLMDADDNALVPTDKGSSLAAEKGLQNAIWMMPLDVLTQTLDRLYQAREQCKQVIYEITGIADIMRGQTSASETLGAQKIKNQWGTLRIKPKQREVQRYTRDLLRMMLEIAATKFSEDTWAKMTGLPYLTQQQAMQAQSIAQAAAASGQPVPPEVQQALQQPTWSAVLAMLRDDTQRAYRIDIETNSTVEPEAVEDQKNISDLMTALGQFLNGVGPLVEKGVMPFEVAQTMMLSICRQFRFGVEIEDQIKQMKAPPPQDDGKAAQQQQAAMQQQMQAAQQLQALQSQLQQAKAQLQATDLEKGISDRETKVALDRLELERDKALFQLEQKVTKESLALRDQVGQEKLANKEGMLSLKEQTVKKEQAHADRAKTTIAKAGQAVDQTRTEILQAIQQQGAMTQAMVAELLAAIRAPRTRVPVRGADGRIERVLDQVAEPQGTMQ